MDLGQLARAFLGLLRDIEIVARVGSTQDLSDLIDASPEELDDLKDLANTARRVEDEARPPDGGRSGLGPDIVAVLFERWARAVDETGKASNPRLILEMAAVDLCQAEPLVPLGDLLERLEHLEGRLRSGGPAAPPPSSSRGGGPGASSSGTTRAPADPGYRAQSAASEAPVAAARASAPALRAVDAPFVRAADAPVVRAGEGPPVRTDDAAGVHVVEAPAVRSAESSPARLSVVPSPVISREDGGGAGAPARSASPIEGWRRAKTALEQRRPRLGALLANANVLEIDASKLTLGFADRADVEAAEKLRGDIEQALAAEFGGPVRLVAKQATGSAAAPVVRAESIDEADAQLRDKRTREQEARQHPMVQKAQDLFGAAIREIKT